jgi:hypothetical protein
LEARLWRIVVRRSVKGFTQAGVVAGIGVVLVVAGVAPGAVSRRDTAGGPGLRLLVPNTIAADQAAVAAALAQKAADVSLAERYQVSEGVALRRLAAARATLGRATAEVRANTNSARRASRTAKRYAAAAVKAARHRRSRQLRRASKAEAAAIVAADEYTVRADTASAKAARATIVLEQAEIALVRARSKAATAQIAATTEANIASEHAAAARAAVEATSAIQSQSRATDRAVAAAQLAIRGALATALNSDAEAQEEMQALAAAKHHHGG